MAVRPWSFLASAMPVFTATTYLWWHGEGHWLTGGLWAMVCIVLFHAAANLWSDYRDYRMGVDREKSACVPTLVTGLFTEIEVLCLAAVLLLMAVAGGIWLMLYVGVELLLIGLLGFLVALAYPVLKCHAMGDVAIFVAYAVLPVIGVSYIVAEQMAWSVLCLIPPVGLITVAILHANNMRDLYADADMGIDTIPMRLDLRAASWLYAAEVAVPYLCVILYVAIGWMPMWSLIVVVTAPLAACNIQVAFHDIDLFDDRMIGLDQHTALLQFLFSILLASSLVAAHCL